MGQVYAEYADLVELGVPFSDPLADGPAIQAAGQRALAGGATLERVLDDVAAPLARRGPGGADVLREPAARARLRARRGQLAGSAASPGLIVPDMPAAEAGELRAVCDEAGIALIPLVAPTTPPDEVRRIAESARGFVYVVSVTGVTGERAALPPSWATWWSACAMRPTFRSPSGSASARRSRSAAVGEIADGVIVGSRLVRGVADAATARGRPRRRSRLPLQRACRRAG